MKRAIIVHDNLNAIGGSERLSFTTLELLNEMNYNVDLATLEQPNIELAKKSFGDENSHLWKFERIKIIDMFSILGLAPLTEDTTPNNFIKNNNNLNYNKSNINENIYDTEYTKSNFFKELYNYDIVINTHGDLFPFRADIWKVQLKNTNHGKEFLEKTSFGNQIEDHRFPLWITYCHYPLLPQMIMSKDYNFLEKIIPSFSILPDDLKNRIAFRALEIYNTMIKSTIILTNSKFSKLAIKSLYSSDSVDPIIIYPPVDTNKFSITKEGNNRNGNIINHEPIITSPTMVKNILVICRIHPSKNIENAIKLAQILKYNRKLDNFKLTIVGNMLVEDSPYLQNLKKLIDFYKIQENVKINPNVPFEELQKLIHRSSFYYHPTLDEPFGISIVETMSAGVIPIVPDNGGVTDFVPSRYQYKDLEEAASKIMHFLDLGEDHLRADRNQIMDISQKFSSDNYKETLKRLFDNTLGSKINLILQRP